MQYVWLCSVVCICILSICILCMLLWDKAIVTGPWFIVRIPFVNAKVVLFVVLLFVFFQQVHFVSVLQHEINCK